MLIPRTKRLSTVLFSIVSVLNNVLNTVFSTEINRLTTIISHIRLSQKFVVSGSIVSAVLILFIPATAYAESVIVEMARSQNDSSAQFFLGRRYLNGYGVAKNTERAAKWFLKAAKQGHKKANFQLGLLYKKGMGVSKDDQTAFQQFLTAAEQGHPGAMFELGNYYFFGLDSFSDIEQALVWYRKSAEKNYGAAQYQLGKILTEGIGVKADRVEGQKWLDASRNNSIDPNISIDNDSYASDTNGQNINSLLANIIVPEQRAQKNIKKETVGTQYRMGMHYLNGISGIKQPEIAFQWLSEAAKKGHTEAQFQLGKMFLGGVGVEKNNDIAFKWINKAADQGLADAISTRDSLMDEKLVRLLKSSSHPNITIPGDQFKAGMLYLEGSRLSRNTSKAAEWIIKAARNGHSRAQFEVGKMYRDGIGFKKDTILAGYWMEKASDSGSKEATQVLFDGSGIGDKSDNIKTSLDHSQDHSQGQGTLINGAKITDQEEQYKKAMEILTGKSSKKNTKNSIQSLTQVANQGYLDAQKQLALIYSRGRIIDRDLLAAAEWLTKAAEAGDADSQYKLGNLYKRGTGVEKSNSLAVKWYRVAARQGHPQARSKLGCKIC